MRKGIAIACGIALLAIANHSIHNREKLMTEGRMAYLELAPVDPRSLMQGDYMALRFKAADDAFPRQRGMRLDRRATDQNRIADGRVVLKSDMRGVATFVRLDDGSELKDGEFVMRYRVRNDNVKFATNAYFFQEGQAARFSAARYGEFRVDEKGEAILTHLRSKGLERL